MSSFELPINEWIVLFYPQTGVARLCPSLDFARDHIKSASMTTIYRNPQDFKNKHDHFALEKCWRALHKHCQWKMPRTAIGSLSDYDETPPDTSTDAFVRMFWQFLQDVGDRLQAPSDGATKTKEQYELKFKLMDELIRDPFTFDAKYNNQARTVFTALFDHGKQFLEEEEIKYLILKLVADRKLKTNQKPWVIFQYYRPQFIKDGYIVRGKLRAKNTRK